MAPTSNNMPSNLTNVMSSPKIHALKRMVNIGSKEQKIPASVAPSLSIAKNRNTVAKMVEMLKEKQNPKINNYIQTMTDLFVEELECWINDIRSTDIYS